MGKADDISHHIGLITKFQSENTDWLERNTKISYILHALLIFGAHKTLRSLISRSGKISPVHPLFYDEFEKFTIFAISMQNIGGKSAWENFSPMLGWSMS